MKYTENVLFQCLVWEIFIIFGHFRVVMLCQKWLKWQFLAVFFAKRFLPNSAMKPPDILARKSNEIQGGQKNLYP